MSDIEKIADQCVRCGLCLPHCPTYRIAQTEPESPRGRIQMLAAFAKQELEWQPSLQRHIDQCLGCGHCERVCPVNVSYAELLVSGRQALAKKHPPSWIKKAAIKIIETPKVRNIFFGFVRILKKIFLWQALAYISKYLFPKMNRAMSFIPKFFGLNPVSAKPGLLRCARNDERVLLFPGCTGENFGRNTFVAAKKILANFGFSVHLPTQSFCCGALSAHAGLGTERSQKTLHAVKEYCEQHKIQKVLTFATGCGGFLKLLQAQSSSDAPSLRAQRSSPGFIISDIQQFLLDHWSESFSCRALAKPSRIAVHTPCTQINLLRNPTLSYDLLKKIPNAEPVTFGEKTCCGAAGSYMLEHEKISDQLVSQILTPELLASCDVITTSNIGCQLQFQRYLKSKKIDIPVCHPIEILCQTTHSGGNTFLE